MSETAQPTEPDQPWAELAAWGREPRLSELDALMWRTDRHPEGSWSGVVIHLLDREPDWDRLRAGHRWFLRVVPRFTQKVVEPAVPVGAPMWADDPSFDLDYHLRRVRIPGPGSRQQLLELAQSIGLTPLDRSRPPWESTLVEGLKDGRAAYVMHAHHVFMDGMALALLHKNALSPIRQSRGEKPAAPPRPPTRLGPTAVAAAELNRQMLGGPRAAGDLTAGLVRSLRAPSTALRYARSLTRVAGPPPANHSKILRGGRQRQWRFGLLECELTELRRAGKTIDATVNDCFVSALLGGLRRYCAAFGEDLSDVPISMPVALRRPDEALGGNKFAGAFFLVPSSISDPAERTRELHRRVDQVRGEPALDFLGNLTPLLNRTPSGVAAAILGSIGGAVLTTSSWPGIRQERYMAGAKFERMFVFAPLPGTAMTSALCTHNGICCIGINADGDVFSDLDLLWRCLDDGLAEILALGN